MRKWIVFNWIYSVIPKRSIVNKLITKLYNLKFTKEDYEEA
jgi:hypothetical protein